MNSESFAEYLAQPAKLYQLPYQEIKNLVEEYPYAANLRLMMFIKSKIEQDPALETHLHRLAAHTFDRDHLFDLNHQQLKEMLDLATGTEERLELQDLSSLAEKEMVTATIATEERTIKTPLAEAIPTPTAPSMPTTEDINLEEDDIVDDIEPLLVDLGVPASVTPVPVVTPKVVENFQPSNELLDTVAVLPLLFANKVPQSKEFFSSWQTYNNFYKQDRLQQLEELAHASIIGFHQVSAKQVAAKSVKQKAEVATETLAKLLEKQGNYEKAIKMYEQLCLSNPEKRRYFAATIEKLKQNI